MKTPTRKTEILRKGKKYLIDNGTSKSFPVKVIGNPDTFSRLIRVMSLTSGMEWYERKHLLKEFRKSKS